MGRLIAALLAAFVTAGSYGENGALLHPFAFGIQLPYAGDDQRERNHKRDPIRKRSCPGDTGNAHYVVEQHHKQEIKTAFAQQRKKQRLYLFPDRLKDRNDHKIDRGCGAGQTDDFQKGLSIVDGLGVRNKHFRNRCGEEIERDRATGGHDQTIQEGRFDRLFHPPHIAGTEIVSNQGERSLRHSL